MTTNNFNANEYFENAIAECSFNKEYISFDSEYTSLIQNGETPELIAAIELLRSFLDTHTTSFNSSMSDRIVIALLRFKLEKHDDFDIRFKAEMNEIIEKAKAKEARKQQKRGGK